MRPRTLVLFILSLSILAGCDTSRSVEAFRRPDREDMATQMRPTPDIGAQLATLIALPSLGGGRAEALAVNNAGTAIAGYGNERARGQTTLRAVRWTLQPNGSWAIVALPLAANSTGAKAAGINRVGDAAGVSYPGTSPHAALWPATGGITLLGCGDLGEGNAISADAQVVVGVQTVPQPAIAAVWHPGVCRENLPPLASGGWARADAVNGDGTIVGGSGAASPTGNGLPVRWKQIAGAWQIEQLDQRRGDVRSANTIGDLAGGVYVPCALADGCQRGAIWYAGGGSRELGTLGGDHSWIRGINSTGEVVGLSTLPGGTNTAYFWSGSLGMIQLPTGHAQWAAANAVSDVRPDGTRLVVGTDARGRPIAWIVQSP